ncbi:PAS domain S-box protein [Sulfurimonas marina]|uniref:histidine kinase n=1 Tax=Sulfurimonas marina TaxID=2590551 RepID=A0A7M3V9C9_9BACT|nr:PAS domain S-box protein [Sulfurimonas marina]QOP40362.1 PAS domain S-box protein [Sulfurimonas marina]
MSDLGIYQTVFNKTNIGMAIVDQSGKLINVNKSLCDFLGYTKEELQNKTFREITYEADLEESVKNLQKINEGISDTFHMEKRYVTKQGQLIWADITVTAIRKENNVLDYYIAVLRNIDELKQTQLALQMQEQKAQLYLDVAAVMLVAVDKKGTIQLINPKGCEILGYSKEELLGKNWIKTVLPVHTQEGVENLIDEIFNGNLELVKYFENPVLTKSGEERLIAWHNEIIKDQNGEAVGIMASGQDITKIRKSEQEIQELNIKTATKKIRYQNLLQNASDGIFIMDYASGDLLEYSQKAKELLGYSDEEMQHLNVLDWDKGFSSLEDYRETIANLTSGPIVLERKHKRKNGTSYDASITASKVFVGQKALIYASVRDITEEIKLKKELVKAKEDAEYSTKIKSEFLANMSHEIRTPLNGVIGFIELAMKKAKSKKVIDYLQKARKSSNALLNVINDILDLSKMEAGKLEIEEHRFVLSKLIDDIRAMFAYSIASKSLKLNVNISSEIPEIVVGDSLRLTQVFNNLISNAIKFTEKGRVSIDITLLKQTSKKIKILCSVSDTGLGIPPKTLSKLFDSFTQSDSSTTRKYGGTGLGLAITKQLIELMKGEIWAESVLGEGSTFYFTLELQLSTDDQSKDIEESEVVENGERVYFNARALLVDDNATNRILAKKILQEYGLSVKTAKHGKKAIDKVKKNDFDIIFMDLHMPTMDGYEASKEIRTFNQTIPIIALSAAVMNGDKQMAEAVGMNEHIAKPINRNVLEKILHRYLLTVSPVDIPSSGNIDFLELEKLFKNDNKVKEFLNIFMKSHHDFCKKIRKMEIGSAPFKTTLHSLKGAAGSIGANKVYSLIIEIESLNDTTQITKMLKILCLEFKHLMEEIENYIAN